jgi:hypothetical protein
VAELVNYSTDLFVLLRARVENDTFPNSNRSKKIDGGSGSP